MLGPFTDFPSEVGSQAKIALNSRHFDVGYGFPRRGLIFWVTMPLPILANLDHIPILIYALYYFIYCMINQHEKPLTEHGERLSKD